MSLGSSFGVLSSFSSTNVPVSIPSAKEACDCDLSSRSLLGVGDLEGVLLRSDLESDLDSDSESELPVIGASETSLSSFLPRC